MNDNVVFKASFDKANRTSLNSSRGPALETFLHGMKNVKEKYGFKLITDIHNDRQPAQINKNNIFDVLQVPAFLSRQTDILLATRRAANIINVKMGQWMSAQDVGGILSKVGDDESVWITYRGTSFGYNNLVVDFTQFQIMRDMYPNINIIFDVTHSVQKPGGNGFTSGGNRDMVEGLARASIAQGYIDGLFLETHPDPDKALSDGPNSITQQQLDNILKEI